MNGTTGAVYSVDVPEHQKRILYRVHRAGSALRKI